MKSVEVEEQASIQKASASALRLLYACLMPLEGTPGGPLASYGHLLKSLSSDLKKELRVHLVLEFMRRALGWPADEHMMLLLLVDEGNAATAPFPRPPSNEPAKVRSLNASDSSEGTEAQYKMQSSGALSGCYQAAGLLAPLRTRGTVEQHLPS